MPGDDVPTQPSQWPEQSPRKRLSFDPTINAGHILTALVTLVSAFSAILALWNSVQSTQAAHDKRITLVETQMAATSKLQETRDANQDIIVRESLVSIKESIADLKRNLENRRER